MNHRKSSMGKSRDLGISGPGKGDKSRVTSHKAYADGYDAIDWGREDRAEINPAWVNAPIGIDEVNGFTSLNTRPTPIFDDSESWDR